MCERILYTTLRMTDAPSMHVPEDAATTAAPGGVSARPARRFGIDPFDAIERYGIILVWIAAIVVFSILRPSTFPTTVNFETISGTQAVLLVMTLGLIVALTSGEFDLSIGAA